MSVHDDACAAIAQQVKETLNGRSSAARLEQQRLQLLQLASGREAKARKRRVLLGVSAVGAISALAAAVLLLVVPGKSDDMGFDIETNGVAVTSDTSTQWIATHDERKIIRFHQGSEFTLLENSAMRVVASTEEMVVFELSRGGLDASVNGNGHTLWRVNAGPYGITVLGTRFQVNWSPENEIIDVRVRRGLVQVREDTRYANGVLVKAGEQFASNGRTHALTSETGVAEQLLSNPNPSLQGDTVSKAEGVGMVSVVESIEMPAETRHTPSGKKRLPSRSAHLELNRWQTFFARSEYADAMNAAEGEGIDRIVTHADAQELWNLALSARNTRRFDVSSDVLLQLRKRFPQSRPARLAAFIIGRTHMDIDSDAARAAEWFNTYLKESRGGAMAEESHGRLMTCYLRLEKGDRAADVARSYLKVYPSGLYSDQAHEVLDR